MNSPVPVLLTLILAATLAACASDKGEVATMEASVTSPAEGKVFARTEAHDEIRVKEAAAAMLRSGSSLGSEEAERCWNTEAGRAGVREACVLAWAPGKEGSVLLENILLEKAESSRTIALALLKRPALLGKLGWAGLHGMLLSSLAKDPPWLRGQVIELWLRVNGSQPLLESRALWRLLRLGDAGFLDPASLSVAYRIAKALGGGKEEELLIAFCAPSTVPAAQVRCWRFLSALVDPQTGQGLDPVARRFLPLHRDEGWILFERSFPERAPLLRGYR